MRFTFILLFLFFVKIGFSQSDQRFRFAAVHNINERNSYSIFYPVNTDEYKGIVILIHSIQASNPKAYGGLIENLLQQGNIVIYPAYQGFAVSSNKDDLNFISSSLEKAYADTEENNIRPMSLPVAFVGHSMGGIIAFELALGQVAVPKKPSCVIALCPTEVRKHTLENLNFNKLDSYDVYLVIEEEKDPAFRSDIGERLITNLAFAKRKKFIVHEKAEGQASKHMNAWSFDVKFSSKNNSLVSYFSKLIGKTNAVDTKVYWPAINQAISCAFSREYCDSFRE